MARRKRSGTRIVAATATGLLLAGTAGYAVSSAADDSTGDGSDRPPAGVSELAVPDLEWSDCSNGTGLECSTLEVPLDYTALDGSTAALALARKPAADTDEHQGSLVLNRGGPGYSAVEYLQGIEDGQEYSPVTDEVTDVYDLVAVDPRGTGESTPAMECFASDEEAIELASRTIAAPHTPEEHANRAKADAAYTEQCQEHSGDLLEHLTSINSARDLDVVRAALGEDQLNYVGQSYGTYLGTVYAATFPESTGRLVFDSVLDPTVRDAYPTSEVAGDADDPAVGTPSSRVGSDVATEETLTEFLRLCTERQSDCVLTGDEGETPTDAFDRLMATLDEGPLELHGDDGETAELTWSYVVTWTGQWLYQPPLWEMGADFLRQAVTALDDPAGPAAAELVESIRLTEEAGMFGGPYTGINPGYHAVTCADTDHPDGHQALAQLADERQQGEAPHFGTLRAYAASPCADWPASGERYEGPWDADTAEPVLIINNRYDPATPIWSAERLHDELPNSNLLVNEGSGHIASMQSSCVRDELSAYLLDGTGPKDGASCEPDWTPFNGEPPPMP